MPYSEPLLSTSATRLGGTAPSGCLPTLSRPLECPSVYPRPWETDRIWCRYLHIWFQMPRHFRLPTHVPRFRWSTCVSCLHSYIAVFLFAQLEHDGSVKGQYAIFTKFFSNHIQPLCSRNYDMVQLSWLSLYFILLFTVKTWFCLCKLLWFSKKFIFLPTV